MKRISNLLLAALVVGFCSCDKDDDNNSIDFPNTTDNNFMTMAAYANNNEIDFGQLALSKSANDSVRMFAQMMVTEHTTSRSGLDSAANRYFYTNLPTGIDSMHAALKTQLSAMSGYMFDTAYINGQIRDHINTINLYQNESNNGHATGIRAYSNNILPHLNMHLQEAQSVASHF